MNELLEIVESADGEQVLMSVRGELDISSSPLLNRRLAGLLGESRSVVLDLSQLEFIDSSGIAVLLSATRAADANGGALAIRSVSSSALRVLELTGVAAALRLPEIAG